MSARRHANIAATSPHPYGQTLQPLLLWPPSHLWSCMLPYRLCLDVPAQAGLSSYSSTGLPSLTIQVRGPPHHVRLEIHAAMMVAADRMMMSSSCNTVVSMQMPRPLLLIGDRESVPFVATSYRTSILYVSRLPSMERAVRSSAGPAVMGLLTYCVMARGVKRV